MTHDYSRKAQRLADAVISKTLRKFGRSIQYQGVGMICVEASFDIASQSPSPPVYICTKSGRIRRLLS